MKRASRSKVVIAQSLALALAAAGAWALVVRPFNARLESAQSELDAVRLESRSIREALELESTPARVSIESVTDHTLTLQELCDRSGDSSRIYDLVGRIAQEHDVRIERMEPKRVNIPALSSSNLRAAKKGAPKGKELPSVVGYGFSIEASGSYGSLASLIDAIEHDLGMSKVMGIRLAPTRAADGSPRVRAIIDTAHYGIDRPLTHVQAKGDN